MGLLEEIAKKEAEIEELKKELRTKQKPVPLMTKESLPESFHGLYDTAICIVDGIDKNGYQDDDDSHYVYEEAMKAIFGPFYFEWVRDKV